MRKFLLFFILFINTLSYGQIDFLNKANDLSLNVSTGITNLGNGVSFYDFNNDGWDDITLTTENNSQLLFFKNIEGNFSLVTLSGISINYETKQVNWVDFDNDGDPDLFVTSYTNGNKLFENIGDLIFQDITITSGIPTSNFKTYGASWGDYNNDGFLDVFISNRDPDQVIPNKLYKNNGNATFTDVSVSSGILSSSKVSFCSAFFDFNNDGWQDIYVANDKLDNENTLYKNNGNGTFTDVSMISGTNINIDAMTVTIGDYNNDGWQDIYVTNTEAGNALLKNNGDETFTDVASSSGVLFNSVGWGAVFLDADNDKDIDLYVSGGLDGSMAGFISAAFYENNGDNTFNTLNGSFNNDNRSSYSNAVGDVDNDGYPEIVVTNNLNQDIFLWKNNTNSSNNWLKINLEGIVSNRDGIGSRIEISVNGEKQYRYTHCGEGYLSQNSGTKFFGVQDASIIDYVKVTWLDGTKDIFNNVSVNQVLNIVEGSSNTLSVNELEKVSPLSYYPNPVNNELTITAKTNMSNIKIYNMLGQVLLNLSPDSLSKKINTSTLNTGSYFIKIVTGNKEETIKIIKN